MMDTIGAEMRQQRDDTMADLTDKLEDLGDQFSGTVKDVKHSMNSVRDTFDVKFQVRRHPYAAFAGAMALGFLFGYQPHGNPRRYSRNSVGPVERARPCAEANGDMNGADVGRSPASATPSWVANLGEMFIPDINALRGIAVGALLNVVREVTKTKEVPKPTPRAARDTRSPMAWEEHIHENHRRTDFR